MNDNANRMDFWKKKPGCQKVQQLPSGIIINGKIINFRIPCACTRIWIVLSYATCVVWSATS